MAMVDMKSGGDAGKAKGKIPGGKVTGESPTNSDAPDYHYALTLHLHPEHVAKLGLDKNPPTVGDMVKLHSHAHVTEVRQEMINGKAHHHVSLELRKMEVQAEHQKSVSGDDNSEGHLKGAKAAMDKALDAEEAGRSNKKRPSKSGKVTDKSYDVGEATDG